MSIVSKMDGTEPGIGFEAKPVRRPADQIRLSLLQAILASKLRPGDRLPSEEEQAKGFGVSRAVVRQALQPLIRQGLLTVVPGRGGGAFVNQLDSHPVEQDLKEALELLLRFGAINVRELLEARQALEGLSASFGASRAGHEEIETIRRILEHARDSKLADEDWLQLDIDFHRAVAKSGHNRALLVPLSAMHGVVQPMLNLAILPLLSRRKVNTQHWEIYESIAAHHPEQARKAVLDHLDYLFGLYGKAGLLEKFPPQAVE